MSDNLTFKIDMAALQRALDLAPKTLAKYLKEAGKSAAEEVIQTRGLAEYPPRTSANLPPVPYYERGYGMHYKSGVVESSENYGKQWTMKSEVNKVVIGNRASYAKFVGGDYQPRHMRQKGWRKLKVVARYLLMKGSIQKIYNDAVKAALRAAGLK